MTLREQILSKRECRRESIQIDGWEFPVFVKVMTGTERDQWEIWWDELRKGDGRKHFRASLLIFTVVDADGAAVFQRTDLDAVGQLPSPAVERLHEAAFRLNRLGKEAAESAEGN